MRKLLWFIFVFAIISGCRAHNPVEKIQPVVVENTSESSDTAREMRKEMDRISETSIEQINERATEKIVITVNTNGDTVSRDRETVYIRDHWLLLENLRLQSKIDSLMLWSRIKEKEQIPVYIEVPVEVEKDYSLWDKIRFKGFWVVSGILAAIGLYRCRKFFMRILIR